MEEQRQQQWSDPDWVGQEWLLGQISSWLGAEETLARACNLCHAWRRWCNNDLVALHIAHEFQRLPSGREGASASVGLSIPLFLPLVPSSLCELNVSGIWTSLSARELGTIRRGCRLRKFVLVGVRLFSFSYRELLLFEHLEEMDISNSHLDVILPRMRYAEPAGGNPVRSSGSRNEDVTTAASAGSDAVNSGDRARAQDGHNVFPRSPFPPPPPPPRPAVPHPSIIALTGRAAGPPAAGYGRDGDRDGSMYDQPRFASTLKKLTAVATRLWSRWDLSKFPQLRTLEVSYAGRTMLQHLHRKAETGRELTELSVCDVALRHLVRPTELHELAEAIRGVSTFRLRRVDVVKEVANFAYLRAILSRLQSLRVLELTDVALDDSMLGVLGEFLCSKHCRSPPPSPRLQNADSASAGRSASSSTGARRPRHSSPVNIASVHADADSEVRDAQGGGRRRGQGLGNDSVRDVDSDDRAPAAAAERRRGGRLAANTAPAGGTVASGASIATLQTLILGRCGGISQAGFQTFFTQPGWERTVGVATGTISSKDRNGFRHDNGGGSSSGGGVGGMNDTGYRRGGSARGAARGTRPENMTLSTVRLQGCMALGDRELALLCAGARGALCDIQVTGSSLLTDRGIKHLAKTCPRLTDVDLSGCPGVTSDSLALLLSKCPSLQRVKAWGIRVSGNLGAVAQTPSSIATARALREAYESRGVQLAWTGPLPPVEAENTGAGEDTMVLRSRENTGSGVGGRGVGDRDRDDGADGLEESDEKRIDRLDSAGAGSVARAAGARGEGGREEGEGRGRKPKRQPCVSGCGAVLQAEDVVDHLEVCPLATVTCLLLADGCSWNGTREQRRRHLKECRMWQVKCPVCCQAVHARDFAVHVLGHSAAGEAPALRPPGCALRAYGCRACQLTGEEGARLLESIDASLAAANFAGGRDEQLDAEKGSGCQEAVDAALVKVERHRGHAHRNPGTCSWYRVVCKSCDREVSRKAWDDGMHSCPVHKRVDVLAKHASGAGMLRNRQWLQIVYGYVGGNGKKNRGGGKDDPRDGAFHGVNPMCAMPSVLSAALPLPGPAGAPASPATPP